MSAAAIKLKIAQSSELLTAANLRVLLDKIIKMLALPGFGILVFLLLWQLVANNIVTSLGQFPGPTQVWEQSATLVAEHQRERSKETSFYERQKQRNAKKLANNPDAVVKVRAYTGKATFVDQIGTSLLTVAFGFMVATLVAVPLGIASGLAAAGNHGGIGPLCDR